MKMAHGVVAIVLVGVCAVTRAADDADKLVPGDTLFAERCASCHEHAQGRVPDTAALRARPPEQILAALRSGVMRTQATGLSVFQMQGIAQYLTGREPGESPATVPEPNACAGPITAIQVRATDWNGWGADLVNSRFQPKPGIKPTDVPRLRLKWAYGYRGSFVYGQPTVIGGRVFTTSSTGRVYSLDARTGCTHWTYDGEASTRTAISISRLPAGAGARSAAYFGDDSSNVHAVDADTGRLLWKVRADPHPWARITGSPKVYRGVLYVGVSSFEIVVAADRHYPCCTFSGSVVALDVRDGHRLWQTKMLPPAQPTGLSDAGTQLSGPAGASVWGSPAVDERRQLLYVGTGNSYTDALALNANAIVALELKTGKIVWSHQITPEDNFNMACARPGACAPGERCDLAGKANCPKVVGPDVDFGAATILRTLAGGQQVLIASQKSGVVYGLDPAQKGAILWSRRVGVGSPLGGIEWGSGADLTTVFAPVGDTLVPPDQARPGLTAIDIATGAERWHLPAPIVACSWGAVGCLHGLQQAASVIPGVVFAGSLDGWLRAYDSGSGQLIWELDTAKSYSTVNGVAAEGGSLDLGGATFADGTMYLNSGYGRLVGHPGNVLLAFSVDGR
ncbi:MAG TPA: PQQ-binding-like beta-propeller repeat protein [Steroidobacteraceae bacterium]|nr:PQQ-binding-like beta-propeller repeat protein [Steroidobacteraceae bacterium]